MERELEREMEGVRDGEETDGGEMERELEREMEGVRDGEETPILIPMERYRGMERWRERDEGGRERDGGRESVCMQQRVTIM